MKSKSSLLILILLLCGNLVFAASYVSVAPSRKVARDDDSSVVILKTNPRDASVYINGNLYGKTDLTITSLPPGYYKVRIEKDGYETSYVQIQVKRGYSMTYDIQLEKIVGYVDVYDLLSDSLVYIDGSRTTSFPAEVSVGDHQVKVRKFGYKDYYANVTVYKKKTVVVRPEYYVAPFEISDFSVSKKVINPDYSNGIGRAEISFEVTNHGSATVYVTDTYDNIVWYNSFEDFYTWNQSCTWKGTNNTGDAVPDGEYRIILTDDEGYTEEASIRIDRTVSFPIVTYTPSGSGIGSLPTAYRITQFYLSPFMFVAPEISLVDSNANLYKTAIGGGLYMDFMECMEIGFSIEGYMGLNSAEEDTNIALNTSVKYTSCTELDVGEYLCVGGLFRYGYAWVNTYEPYGIDTGKGIGLGGIIGFDSNKYYVGVSSEYIWGGPNGGLINGLNKCSVWKNGVVLTGKLSKSFSVSGWAALHSCFGLYNEDGTVSDVSIFDRGKEFGVEIAGVPGSSSLIMDLKIKALLVGEKNTYISADFGLSYLF